jgi:ferritin-like metal-binding protein YciE
MPMTDPKALFVHELGDILYAERLLVKTLPRLVEEASDGELRRGFKQHLEETRQQVGNVESVFQSIGEMPKAERCPGIDGITKEHDDFMAEEHPSPEIRDIFLTGAGARVEHYEIAAYSGLIEMAKALGQDDAVELLGQNLTQEKEALKALEAAGRRLGRRAAGADRRAGRGARRGRVDADGGTRDELLKRARRLGVRGRSRMTKKELATAVARAQS